MSLKFKNTDWLAENERQKEEIIEDLASQISAQHPEMFSGGALTGEHRKNAEEIVRSFVVQRDDLTFEEQPEVINKIMGQVSGYGPLEEFFTGENSEEITEVMVNPSQDGVPKVFYGMHGRPHYAGNHYFKNDDELTKFCIKISEDVGKPFNAQSPIVDAWMNDGSRVAMMGFKLSPLGTALTIRKSPLVRPPLPLSALVESGTIPQFVSDLFVDLIVKGHTNLGVFGRTDSGKTTTLRSLGEFIDPVERVIIGETSYELSLPHLPNLINLVEIGQGREKLIDMNDICEAINRNNPDRAIVGELRGGEIVAASEIAESTSGGFWTTGHSGNLNQLRSRFPKMFQRGGMPLPRELVDDQIQAMFHFLLFQDKSYIDSKRALTSLVEITPDGEYRTIIEFDKEEFARTNGQVRRWIYKNPVSPATLGDLAFRGAVIKDEYREVHQQYLYEGE